MRRMIGFDCCGDWLAGSLDEAAGTTGLLIVSGGNEIRSGAYAGQAAMARHFAHLGHPVFRYDRRGVGDSEGANGGFESSADDLMAAVTAFRAEAPHMQRIVAFGNCDAATALAFFHAGAGVDTLILANPWVIEVAADHQPPLPNASAIRSRYWARLKNPRSLIYLLTGRIDLRKLLVGLAKAKAKEAPTQLSVRLADALSATGARLELLVAAQDNTAMAFVAAWRSRCFSTCATALMSVFTSSRQRHTVSPILPRAAGCMSASRTSSNRQAELIGGVLPIAINNHHRQNRCDHGSWLGLVIDQDAQSGAIGIVELAVFERPKNAARPSKPSPRATGIRRISPVIAPRPSNEARWRRQSAMSPTSQQRQSMGSHNHRSPAAPQRRCSQSPA